ncbi:hypothetical protein GCM10011588_61100 [Nocardia jinanensis]|uniref:Uncharacterized protein n=1 Tax=Nocardia jinanensis TaxID=382504 RepID=A0A917RV82_9NOCA|nr:hypothetical protein GCM10011588_61100 [Nocardia jinanensis]
MQGAQLVDIDLGYRTVATVEQFVAAGEPLVEAVQIREFIEGYIATMTGHSPVAYVLTCPTGWVPTPVAN